MAIQSNKVIDQDPELQASKLDLNGGGAGGTAFAPQEQVLGHGGQQSQAHQNHQLETQNQHHRIRSTSFQSEYCSSIMNTNGLLPPDDEVPTPVNPVSGQLTPGHQAPHMTSPEWGPSSSPGMPPQSHGMPVPPAAPIHHPGMPHGAPPMPPPTSQAQDLVGDQKPPLCAGCRLRIMDKYLLAAVEQKWHSSCLKCAECGVELETHNSCFEKNGSVFCKEDYLRMYANRSKSCARCHQEIQSSDLVMKARQSLYHVDCFRCARCDLALRKGDLFGMFEDVLYCRHHFELETANANVPPANVVTSLPHPTPPADASAPPPPPGSEFVSGAFPPPPGAPGYGQFHESWFPPHGPPPGGPGGDYPPLGPHGDAGPPGPGPFPYDNNNEPLLKKRRGRKKRKVPVENFAAMNGYLDGPGGPGAYGGPGCPGLDGSQAKTKRARTSFKHHQLRIMKAHFQINQNPDSRELKMLSQKTGLDKKVLQVWFQNARAKWRRTKAQDGGGNAAPGAPTNSAQLSAEAGLVDSVPGAGPGSGSAGGAGGLSMASLVGGEASPTSSSDCSSSGAMVPCC